MTSLNSKLLKKVKTLVLNNESTKERSSSLIKEVQRSDSALEITSLYKFLEKDNGQISEIFKREIIKKFQDIYQVLPEEAKFLIEFESLQAIGPKELDFKVDYFLKFIAESVDTIKHDSRYDFAIRNKHILGLDLSRWEINMLPESISSLSELQYLNLSNCQLKSLPNTLELLKNIKEVVLKGNKLLTVPDSLISIVKRNYIQKYVEEGVHNSEVLVLGLLEILSGKRLVKVDYKRDVIDWDRAFHYQINEAGYITGLFLSLENVEIRTFPEQICILKHLKELKLTQVYLESIPESIRNLITLRKLNLSFNKIKSVPSSIEELKNLEFFSLDDNEISEEGLYSLTWYKSGQKFIDMAEYEKAIEECLETLKTYPRHEVAWYHLGLSYEENGDFDKAEEALNHVIEINSNNAAAWNKLADIYLVKSDYERAIKTIKHVLNIEPDVALFWGNLGFVYKKTGKLDDAISAYKRSLEIEPKNSKIWAALASIYRDKGEHEKEKNAYERSFDV